MRPHARQPLVGVNLEQALWRPAGASILLTLASWTNVDQNSYEEPHDGKHPMKTVQMTLDESLVEQVDRAAESLGTPRSAFTRDALRAALVEFQERERERRHRAGYERHPAQPGELDGWEDEQVWPADDMGRDPLVPVRQP